jgi:hypothetical protein
VVVCSGGPRKQARKDGPKDGPPPSGYYGTCPAEAGMMMMMIVMMMIVMQPAPGSNDAGMPILNLAFRPAGVRWNRAKNKWMSYISVGGSQQSLGLFDEEVSQRH